MVCHCRISGGKDTYLFRYLQETVPKKRFLGLIILIFEIISVSLHPNNITDMKKTFFLLTSAILCLVLVACSGSKKNNESVQEPIEPTFEQTKSGVKAAVTRMYADYFRPVTTADPDSITEGLNLWDMTEYFSPELDSLMRVVEKIQEESSEAIVDYDPFINAQDCQNLELYDVEVTDFTPEKATALVSFMNLGQKDTAIVVMDYNEAKKTWLLSDFIQPEFKTSYIEFLKEYVNMPAEAE